MSSIPRQLATFAAVLAGLFAVGAIAGQIIDPKPHGSEGEAHEKEMPEMTSSTNTARRCATSTSSTRSACI